MGAWHLESPTFEAGDDPPDVIVVDGQRRWRFEVTRAEDATSHERAAALDAFHRLMNDLVDELPEQRRSQFVHLFRGRRMALQFTDKPPARNRRRSAQRVLEWLIENPDIGTLHEFATDAPPEFYRRSIHTRMWAPPIPQLAVVFASMPDLSDEPPRFGSVSGLRVWDPKDALISAIRSKIDHGYNPNDQLHLAVRADVEPSDWMLQEIRSELSDALLQSPFESIWITGNDVVARLAPSDPKPATEPVLI